MKNNIVKIVLTVVAVLAIVLIFLASSPKIEEGSITIILLDQTQEELINKNIEFTQKANNAPTTLYTLLDSNFDIDVRGDGFLLRFETVETDGVNNFLKILLNDTPATRGIKTLEFKDGDVIKFVFTKVGIAS